MIRIFVTGTDTNVGKTVVSAAVVAATNAYYWKPVQTGAEVAAHVDCAVVRKLAGLDESRVIPSTYSFAAPLAPDQAAVREGCSIDLAAFVAPAVRPLVVEGAGGVLVPLNDSTLMIDLMAKLDLPVLLVARSTLGTINHTLLSIDALRARGRVILGVVLNGPVHAENRAAIERHGRVPVLAELPPLTELGRRVLAVYGARIAGRILEPA